MAHTQDLKAFRWLGGISFRSNTRKIWIVLIFLSLVTIFEVVLGIYKPEILLKPFMEPFESSFFGFIGNVLLSPIIFLKPLNSIFIFLTLVKAYYIAWDFMHLRDEKSGLRRAIVWTPIFLVSYLIAILLIEANYVYDVFNTGFMTWDF